MDGSTITALAICATVGVSVIAAAVSSVLTGKTRKPIGHVIHQGKDDATDTDAPAQVSELTRQVAALKAEVAQLRDTATQYDLSIQHTLDETQHRLAALETRRRIEPAHVSPADEQRQSLGG